MTKGEKCGSTELTVENAWEFMINADMGFPRKTSDAGVASSLEYVSTFIQIDRFEKSNTDRDE